MEAAGLTHIVLGTCSLCGGPVTVPRVWMGVTAPVPKCGTCGAWAKTSHGPTIEMDPQTRPHRTKPP